MTKQKQFISRVIAVVLLCQTPGIFATLTTLMDYDPAPIYSASNSTMPPDAHFHNLIKEDMMGIRADTHRRAVGITISPFVQRAVTAKDSYNTSYGIVPPTAAGSVNQPYYNDMGNFRGSINLLGLFIGNDPQGNNIWSGNNNNLTLTTDLKTNLAGTAWPADINDAFVNLRPIGNNGTTNDSVFSVPVIEQDQQYFGAITWPAVYQKMGARFEFNLDLTKDFGLFLQGGVADLRYNTPGFSGLSTLGTYTLPLPTPPTYVNAVYNQVIDVQGGATPPDKLANGATFTEWIDDNYTDLLTSVGYDISNFQETRFEDFRAYLFVRHAFDMQAPEQYKNRWGRIIFTPYLQIGCTLPTGQTKNYSQLLGLSFGNDGHMSAGATGGFMFDFEDAIEVGGEVGVTFFMPRTINDMPCPTHQLQRIVFPFKTDVTMQPGNNIHFSVCMNAYNFMENVNFYAMFRYVQHMEDKYTLVNANPNFHPEYLNENSMWNSQIFNLALSYTIHPGIQIGGAWQGSVNQDNARASQTLLGSITFMF